MDIEGEVDVNPDWTPLYKASVILGPKFKRLLQRYRANHAYLFVEANEAKKGESSVSEYSLEQHETHKLFAQECGEALEKYVEAAGTTIDELFEECQECLDGKWCALFAEDINQWFVDLCVNLQDFQWFAREITASDPCESKR